MSQAGYETPETCLRHRRPVAGRQTHPEHGLGEPSASSATSALLPMSASWPHTVTVTDKQRVALRAGAFASIALAAIVLAWLLMPYPENGCPDEYGSTCHIPSDRQQRWLALVPVAIVLTSLMADVLIAHLRRQKPSWLRSVIPAALGSFVVIGGHSVLLAMYAAS